MLLPGTVEHSRVIATRKANAWAILEGARRARPASPDFSDVNNTDELEWAKAGGRPADYRALMAAEDEIQERIALEQMAASCGGKVALSTTPAPKSTRALHVELTEAEQAALRKLGLDPKYAEIETSDDLRDLKAGAR